MNCAKPSLSQMSRQLLTETESPNHWWASSCTTSAGVAPGQRGVGRPGLVLQREATGRLVTSPPVAEKG